MPAPTRPRIIVVSESLNDRWGILFKERLSEAAKKGEVPFEAIVEHWSAGQVATAGPSLSDSDAPVVLLLLLTSAFIGSVSMEALISTQGRNVQRFQILCEPVDDNALPWQDFGEDLLQRNQPLSLQDKEGLANAVDSIVKSVAERMGMMGELPADSVRIQSSEEPVRPQPGTGGSQPLTRLSEFDTVESIGQLMKDAVKLATGPTPPNRITTSFMLFALCEAASGDDNPWAATFLRDTIVRGSSKYVAVRDSYLEGKGARKQARPQARDRQPVVMTSNMFATFGRASDFALRTTGQPVIHARHLLAALLCSGREPDDFGVLRRLKELDVDPADLRLAQYDWMRGFGDRDAIWAEILIGEMPAVRRLGGFTADRAGGTGDLLGIDTEVQAFAALIAARTLVPPLSIGLFGEWGSGKTFFMRALRSAVDSLSAEARAAERMQRELPFYKHIAQIEFNAWHYVEGNLWASLVEHILENLYQRKDPLVTRQLQECLIKKLADETALSRASSAVAATAQAATQQAQDDLDKARTELNTKTDEVATLTAKSAANDFVLTGASKPVDEALTTLGLDKVGDSAVELEAALRRLHTLLGRGHQFVTPLLRAPDRGRRLTWLFLTLLGAPIVAAIINYAFRNVSRGEIYAYASGLATLIASGIPWLKRQADWMSERLDQAEAAQRAFDTEMAKQTAAHVKQVTAAEQKLRELMASFEAAEQRHAEAKARQAAAAADLAAATTGRLLANFITDRAASADYRKHLGMLALVRDDFEKLSGLIEEENWRLAPVDLPGSSLRDGLEPFADLDEENTDSSQRINRIVLYIDDLDRCPPNKVVDVLQAVHLLLAFPLFVVVVGVDARWITKSLEARYRELLRLDTKDSDANISPLLGAATPNDYLEKIFQIPFWLRPMGPSASETMLRGLLKGSVAPPAEAAGHPSTAGAIQSGGAVNGTPSAADQPGSIPQEGVPVSPRPAALAPATPVGSASPEAPDPKAKHRVLDLTISGEELDYMAKLAGILGRSPRSLKRFVNVYRLIKAGLEEHELHVFTRPRSPIADYQAVLFLLAVDTGTPLAAKEFFKTIEARASTGEAVSVQWLRAELKRTPLGRNADQERLRDWLVEQQDVLSGNGNLSLLSVWTTRVGRYSFEVGRA